MQEDIVRKLNRIKENYGDGSEFVLDVTRDYEKLLEEKNFLNHPIFKDIVKDITIQVNGLNALLLNDESIADKQRDRIFAERRALKIIVKKFGIEIRDDALIALEELIDSKLN